VRVPVFTEEEKKFLVYVHPHDQVVVDADDQRLRGDDRSSAWGRAT
jgi:hypothetical protein